MSRSPKKVVGSWPVRLRGLAIATSSLVILVAYPFLAAAQEASTPEAPAVAKVEPPNWWIGLTPDLMLLLSGKHLEATHASCNLPEVTVGRTQSSADGDYLFLWLKFAPELRRGTVICRITTTNGQTSFELP